MPDDHAAKASGQAPRKDAPKSIGINGGIIPTYSFFLCVPGVLVVQIFLSSREPKQPTNTHQASAALSDARHGTTNQQNFRL
jgi:hypothetical protein